MSVGAPLYLLSVVALSVSCVLQSCTTSHTQDPISRRVVRRRSSYTIPLSFFEVRPILAIIQFYGFLLASLIQGHIKASHPLISDV